MAEKLTMGGRIKRYRELRGLSQTGLAQQARISRRTLILIEEDKEDSPKLGTLRRIANVLRVHIKDLIPDREPAGV